MEKIVTTKDERLSKVLPPLVSAVVSAAMTWLFFVQVYKPSESDFLVTATSHYFKHMSESGLATIASYEDCSLIQSDSDERRLGISMFGICNAENDSSKFFYEIAMSATASFTHSNFESVSK